MKPKIFVALPIYRDVSPLFLNGIMGFMAAPPCPLEVSEDLGNPWIQNSRNVLSASFLAGDCSHILFIDSDMIPAPAMLARLISHNVPIVGGMYCKKKDGAAEMAVKGMADAETSGPLLQVQFMGAGFLLIHRSVFDAMIHRFGDRLRYIATLPDGSERAEYDFWSQGVYEFPNGERQWLGEDAYFCERAAECGFHVWADTKTIVPHIGRAIYPMKHQRETEIFKTENKPEGEPVTINQR